MIDEISHSDLTRHRGKILTLWVVLITCLLLLLTGCGSSKTAVVVDEPSAVVMQAPDTTIAAAPTPIPRVELRTEALRVTEFQSPDTTSPSTPFTAIAFTDSELRVRLEDREVVFRAPARGETVVVTPDTSGKLEAGVKGRPEPRTIEVPEPDSGPGFFTVLGWVTGSIVLVLVLILAIRVVR